MSVASVNRVKGFVGMQRSLGLRAVAGSLLQKYAAKTISTSAILNQSSAAPASDEGKKIYELRTYCIKPKKFGDFMKLTNEHIHLRTEKSKLCGYWTSELGGLNEVMHIWEYDNYTHRTETRKALSQDEEWLSSYLKPILKMLVKQDNFIMNPVPWFDVKPPMTAGGIYELRVYNVIMGQMEQWIHRFIQGFPERCQLSEPAGIWTTEIGHLNQVVLLWPYQSLDDRTKIRKEARKLEEWTEAVRDCQPLVIKGFSKVLVPTEFSLWK